MKILKLVLNHLVLLSIAFLFFGTAHLNAGKEWKKENGGKEIYISNQAPLDIGIVLFIRGDKGTMAIIPHTPSKFSPVKARHAAR